MDDLEKEWTWSNKFDFIYGRAMLGCFADLQSIIQKSYKYGYPLSTTPTAKFYSLYPF